MIKIAILHYSCPPVAGDIEEIVRQQASLFHRYNHPVKIIAGSGAKFSRHFDIELNPLISSQNPEILDLQKNPAGKRRELVAVSDKIHRYLNRSVANFDVLIAHNVLSMGFNLPLTLALHKLADENHIKVVGWNHDSPYFYEDHPKGIDGDGWSILKKYNSNINYIAVSPNHKREFQDLYGIDDGITVIPNGIDPIGFFRLEDNTLRIIGENKLFEADLLVVQPSRLHPRKNMELSIKVIKALHDLGIKAKLLLTGPYAPNERRVRNYCNTLRELAISLGIERDIIIIAEYVFENKERMEADRVTMCDLYQISDILFLPGKKEAIGMPILEAGMIKLPIACPDTAPFRSIAEDNVCFFSPDDPPEKIALSVLKYLKGLKPHGMYRKVIRHHVWDNIYHHHLKPFLEKLFKENRVRESETK